MKEFEDSQEFNEELELTELLRRGDYQAVDRLIGGNPAMARKAFQNYRALKSLTTIGTIEELTHATKNEAIAKSGKLEAIKELTKNIKEIVISQVREGVDTGLRLISGEEFMNVPALGATRGDKEKSISETFVFSRFSISQSKPTSAHESEATVFMLTIPQAQKVKVTITEKTEKMIYQGKRVNHLELLLTSGGYEIHIDDEVWRLVLA